MSNELAAGPVVWIVSGPSGSGKTTLCTALLKDPVWRRRLRKSVSYTTRPPRAGEVEGRDYCHVTKKTFLALMKRRAFLEYEKIFGSYYGTPKKILAEAETRGQDVLLSIDVKGAATVRRALKGRARSIFIMPPDRSTLLKRLTRRSTETKKEIENRLKRVKIEVLRAKEYDYIVVNDDLKKAVRALKAILTAVRRKRAYGLRSAGKTDR
jgi:guanylate kinase